MTRRRKMTKTTAIATIMVVVLCIAFVAAVAFFMTITPSLPEETLDVIQEITLIVGGALVFFIMCWGVYLEIKHPELFPKSTKKPKTEYPTRRQYENYYRTGNRRFLYDPDFKG